MHTGEYHAFFHGQEMLWIRISMRALLTLIKVVFRGDGETNLVILQQAVPRTPIRFQIQTHVSFQSLKYIKRVALKQASLLNSISPFVICLEGCLSSYLLSIMLSETEGQSPRLPTLVTYCQRGEFSIALPLHSYVDDITFSPLYIYRMYVLKSIEYDRSRLMQVMVQAISSLGDDHIRYDVIKPVLECCSADTLLRLEQTSPVRPVSFHHAFIPESPPHSVLKMIPLVSPIDLAIPLQLSHVIKEIWQRLCRRGFPLSFEQYLQEGSEAPKSWREQYFVSSFLCFRTSLDKGRSCYERLRPNGLNY